MVKITTEEPVGGWQLVYLSVADSPARTIERATEALDGCFPDVELALHPEPVSRLTGEWFVQLPVEVIVASHVDGSYSIEAGGQCTLELMPDEGDPED